MSKTEEHGLPKIGYLYHYPRLDHPTDIYRLDIHITSEPTNQHFDVFRVRFPIKTKMEEIEYLKVTHPWNYENGAVVCAGKAIMEDQKGKKEEAFTFGGQLDIKPQKIQTTCVLVSPAPILDICAEIPSHQHFIERVEILLAEVQAKFSDQLEYEKRLVRMEPMDLYLACLLTLSDRYEQLHQKTDEQYQFLYYLHSQMYRLKAAKLIKDNILLIDRLFGIDL